jgi:hypothetical protein
MNEESFRDTDDPINSTATHSGGFMSAITFARLASACLVSALLTPNSSSAQSNPKLTDGLIRESEVIVSGKVGGLASEWTPKRERIQTRVTLAVDEAMKGTVPGNAMTIVVPGGEVDGVGEWYSHTATFQNNEEVVVFAKKDASGHYRVAGGRDGKFLVQKDARTGAKTVQNVGTFDAFKSAIAKGMKASKDGNQ